MIREYLTKIGRKGGKARAARHSKAELSKWAKLGGKLASEKVLNQQQPAAISARLNERPPVSR